MNSHAVYRLIIAALLMLIAGIGFVLWRGVSDARAINDELRLDEQKLLYRLKSLAEEKAYKQEYYFRLIHDDNFADRVIRQKLGFIGQGELVFKFDDSSPVSIEDPFESRVAPRLDVKDKSDTSGMEMAVKDENAPMREFVIEQVKIEPIRLPNSGVKPAAGANSAADSRLPAQDLNSEPAGETVEKGADSLDKNIVESNSESLEDMDSEEAKRRAKAAKEASKFLRFMAE